MTDAFSLLTYITSNKVDHTFISAEATPTGWLHFLGAILLIYSILAIIITSVFVRPSSSDNQISYTLFAKTSMFIVLSAVIIILIVPLYTRWVYPYLPQQIGGGQLLKVEVSVSTDELKSYLSDKNLEVNLIDRTSDSSFFLVVNNESQEYKVIEIQNDIIQNLVYAHSP